MKDGNGNIVMEHVRLVFRNFQGLPTLYNPKGEVRDFCVVLPEEIVQPLIEDNWNVKTFRIREEGDIPEHYLKVKVHYGVKRVPKIFLITAGGRNRTPIDEDMVGMLDLVDIAFVDLIVRPYHWDVRGETGVTGYLKTMFVHIQEDVLEEKYRDVPEIGVGALAIDNRDIIEAELLDDEERPAIGWERE